MKVYSKKYEKPARRKKGPPIKAFFSFLPYLCVSVVAPIWLRIINHEMACYTTYVKHQLFKDAAVYIQQYFFVNSLFGTAGATLALNII